MEVRTTHYRLVFDSFICKTWGTCFETLVIAVSGHLGGLRSVLFTSTLNTILHRLLGPRRVSFP